MELITGAYNKPIICDGNSCNHDYGCTWIACNTNNKNLGERERTEREREAIKRRKEELRKEREWKLKENRKRELREKKAEELFNKF